MTRLPRPPAINQLLRSPQMQVKSEVSRSATCPTCGPIERVKERINVYLGRTATSYWCPICGHRITKKSLRKKE